MEPLAQLLEQRSALVARMNTAHTADDGDAFSAAENELRALDAKITRARALDAADRADPGTPLNQERTPEFRSYSLARRIAAQLDPTIDAAREREIEQELARRSSQTAQGIRVPLEYFETRAAQTTATSAAIVPDDYRPELFTSALTAATVMQAMLDRHRQFAREHPGAGLSARGRQSHRGADTSAAPYHARRCERSDGVAGFPRTPDRLDAADRERLGRNPALRSRAIGRLPVLPWGMVTVQYLASGRLAYDVTDGRGGVRRLLQGEVLHLRDRTDDGLIGRSRLSRAADTVSGVATANTFARTFLERGAAPSGVEIHGHVDPAGGVTIRLSVAAPSAIETAADDFDKRIDEYGAM